MGQLMGIVGPLLLLGGAVFVIAKRCELLGLCGETTPDSGDVAVTSGGVDESATNQNEQGNWAGGNKSCCVCEMQGDRVKCQRHGGAWFNPPAGPGGSNDQSVELSLEECNKGCGTTGTDPQSQEANETKTTSCPSGYNSINGKCTKITQASSGTGKGTGQNASTAKKSSGSSSSNKPSTGNLGEKGTTYVQQPVRATGSASYLNKGSGYKPGGGTYYTYYPQYIRRPVYRSYFVDPNYIRPFNLYHRIAN